MNNGNLTNWVCLADEVILAVHHEQLVEHGGIAGVRDAGMFESAMQRARNMADYGKPDYADLAAAYGHGLAKNHPFLDGNKRTAFVATELFLALNGYVLIADDMACIFSMLAVAASKITEADFAIWIRNNAAKR